VIISATCGDCIAAWSCRPTPKAHNIPLPPPWQKDQSCSCGLIRPEVVRTFDTREFVAFASVKREMGVNGICHLVPFWIIPHCLQTDVYRNAPNVADATRTITTITLKIKTRPPVFDGLFMSGRTARFHSSNVALTDGVYSFPSLFATKGASRGQCISCFGRWRSGARVVLNSQNAAMSGSMD
jgi:hypothetical protein